MSDATAITLENEAIRLRVLTTGAEICEFTHKSTEIDHIWGADPLVWGSHAPVLFPAVGRLLDDMFREGEKSYPHPKHGIVRRSQLSVVHQTASEVWLSLVANVETRRAYPFEFELRIGFVLEGNRVSQRFEVYNNGDISMPFAIGGHPGFSIPMTAQTDIDDYYLLFEKNEQ
jgi:galactose mutarotase-like enzyme